MSEGNPMCYDPDNLPTAEDTARELRQMRWFAFGVSVIAVGLAWACCVLAWRMM